MNVKSIHHADWHSRGIALFSGRFLVRPMARTDESFLGYRLRVAFANGLTNPGWLDCLDPSLPKVHGIARWCPHCLSDSGCHWREDWYSGTAACLAHRCWLTSVCAACRQTLRWKQVRFTVCTCGEPLQDAAVDEFSAEVVELIDEQITSSAALLSVGERWNLARFLGALSQFGLQGKPLKRASRRAENVEQLLVTVGASLIADQSACFELLDRLRAPQASANNVPLLSEVFPNLLTMLRKRLNEAERRWMLDLLNAYVTNSSHRGYAVLWEQKGIAGQTDNERGELQKTRNPAIATMLTQTGVTVPVRRTRAGRQKFVIYDAGLQVLREVRRSLVPLKTAARHAGMSTRRIQTLVMADLIASTEARIGAVRLAFRADRVLALRNIFAGRDDVISVIKTSAASDSGVSIVEAARRLGVKQEVMYHLVNVGLVRTRTGRLRRRVARVIDVDDLREFDEQFIPLITIVKAMGIAARKAREWAMQHGIEIVSGPLVDGGRQYWIRRCTVPETCRSTVRAA